MLIAMMENTCQSVMAKSEKEWRKQVGSNRSKGRMRGGGLERSFLGMLGVGTKYVDSYDGKLGKHLPVCDCIVREIKEKTGDSNRSKGRRGC